VVAGPFVLILIVWLALGASGLALLRMLLIRSRVQERLRASGPVEIDFAPAAEESRNWYAWWLYRAGFRTPRAPLVFGLVGILFAFIAATGIWMVYNSGLVQTTSRLLAGMPGGVGEVFLPLAWSAPWIGGLCIVAIPAMLVRSRRRARVTAIEQDLPVTLDLLSTLTESGLGFDAALDRVLQTQASVRPLAQDLRLFQLDILAGRGRIEALRRLMRRVDVAWFSIFISAVIHAEQIGSGLTQTLRAQADDLRNRRRERVLALAMGIPVKLVFPLVACFLPGIMLAAIGPTAFQLLRVMDSTFLQQGGFQQGTPQPSNTSPGNIRTSSLPPGSLSSGSLSSGSLLSSNLPHGSLPEGMGLP
jgi:tight adherence protein C